VLSFFKENKEKSFNAPHLLQNFSATVAVKPGAEFCNRKSIKHISEKYLRRSDDK